MRIIYWLARLHPSNWKNDNWEYPQLWWIWRKIGFGRPHERTIRRLVLENTCKSLTGHEPSETEWGYGGGDYVDRWCNKLMKVHKKEEPPPTGELRNMSDTLGFSNNDNPIVME